MSEPLIERLQKEKPPGTVLLVQLGEVIYEVIEADPAGVTVRLARDFKVNPDAVNLEIECPEVTNYWFLKV